MLFKVSLSCLGIGNSSSITASKSFVFTQSYDLLLQNTQDMSWVLSPIAGNECSSASFSLLLKVELTIPSYPMVAYPLKLTLKSDNK